ncbi:hypothetical protein OHA72_46350 [Dactylosporangium sp. NBC_01737]|uniref:hypothetical protein n=1 Tax=Dactylosporangium sp. NBC_01737 TaxID=2975959 RepID=UPI002E14919C|nr:hypothetical protein OHA72_46350 [Dactylosporangium sp. NBC_01737]
MDKTEHLGAAAPARRSPNWGRFARHYVEMVVAMFAGMLLLGGALRVTLAMSGADYSMERFPELTLVEMGATMALGMAAWMAIRRHSWTSNLQMSLAMLVPGVAMVPFVRLDLLSAGTAMVIEHAAMFPLMLLIMLRHRDEYLGHHHR